MPDNGHMKPKDLIQFFGTRRAVCDFFGIKNQSLQEWIDDDRVPMRRQYEAQIKTTGRLMASNDQESPSAN